MINWPELEELAGVKQQEAVYTKLDRDLFELNESNDEGEIERRTLRRRLADAFIFVGGKLDPEAVAASKD